MTRRTPRPPLRRERPAPRNPLLAARRRAARRPLPLADRRRQRLPHHLPRAPPGHAGDALGDDRRLRARRAARPRRRARPHLALPRRSARSRPSTSRSSAAFRCWCCSSTSPSSARRSSSSCGTGRSPGRSSGASLPALTVRDFDFTWRAIFALTVSYSAYLAEIFRAGIEAVPKGQVEAAHVARPVAAGRPSASSCSRRRSAPCCRRSATISSR